MKLVCIGRNYTEHISELNNEKPQEPVVFIKPDSAILSKNNPFYIPDFSKNIQYEAEIIVKIKKIGKYIDPKFSYKYYDEISLGIDFTARDLQQKLKSKGLPWEKAKGFDGSAIIGNFINKNIFDDLQNINFSLSQNNKIVQKGNTSHMIWSIDKLIAHVSQYFTLKIGDIIFTGTPSGVGTVNIDDTLIGMIENQKLLKVNIK